MKKILILPPVSEKEMMIQNRNILTINEIQCLKGFESMTIVGTTSTYHTLSSVCFRRQDKLEISVS